MLTAQNASFAKLLEYDQRARGAEDTAQAGPASGDWAGLAFRVGNHSLVCSLESIHESLPIPAITRVPGTKPFILGLANVRGDLITVVDLGCYLTGKRSQLGAHSRLLATLLRGRPVGLLVDEVRGQRNIMSDDTSPPEPGAEEPLASLVRQQHRSGTETWQELSLEILFNLPEFLDGAAA